MAPLRPPIDPSLLLRAYRAGLFPMAEAHDGKIVWYSPDPRAIIPLDAFSVSRSLRRLIRRQQFEVRFNTAFRDVIRACAERDETWISREIIESYAVLHELGYAHSVESWEGETIAGGLYGVAIGGAFFGESMFSRTSGASKVALVALVRRLSERGFILLDTQFLNSHLVQFGTREIPKAEYLELLKKATGLSVSFLDEPASGHTS